MATLGEYIGAGSGTTKLLLHLNGNSNDSSGNANNGTDTAITYSVANGRFGQGAGFNGTTSKVAYGTTGIPTGAGARTMSAWLKLTAQPSMTGYPFSIVSYGTNSNGQLSCLFYDVDNATGVYNLGFSGWNADVIISDNQLSLDTWYNLIATYDGTTVRVYLNGNEFGNGNVTLNTTTANPVIGNGGDLNWWFNGSIDEVIIENTAWSASKIKKYYTNSKGRFATL